jgi:signal transduction histidine kinase
VNWLRKSVVWQAPAWRAVIEGLVVGLLFIIALILVADELPNETIRSGLFFSSVITGTVAGFRAKPSDANPKKRILRFVIMMLSLAVLLPLGAWGTSQVLEYPVFLQRTGISEFESELILICSSVVYGCWRIFGILWRRWQYMRRTRFAWNLTASFVTVVTGFASFIMLVYFIFLLFQDSSTDAVVANTSWAARILRELAIFIFPQLTIYWFTLVFMFLVTVPPLLLFSFYSTRKLTRRVESLANATRRLQQGDLSARTLISGEDEVAQLQSAFNDMAENLQNATRALQTEHDKVTTLLRSQRELTASISHELRTPVAALRAYLENNLTQNRDLSPNLRNDIEIMAHETEQLQKMVDDLFTLAQKETNQLSLNLQPVELASFLIGWAAKFRPVAWKNHKVELQCDSSPNLPAITADPQRLEQIMNNLVQNAVRHTLPGGLVQVQAVIIEDRLRISVRDNGEGIAPEELEHVWERYFRGKNHQHQGSGLGLALVKELAESMGATVGVESTLGEGSHFWLEWGKTSTR